MKKKRYVYECYHCGSHRTDELPGGVVVECLECGWAMNKDRMKRIEKKEDAHVEPAG